MDILSLPERKSIDDRAANSQLAVLKVTKSQFADDLALYASTHEKHCRVCKKD